MFLITVNTPTTRLDLVELVTLVRGRRRCSTELRIQEMNVSGDLQ